MTTSTTTDGPSLLRLAQTSASIGALGYGGPAILALMQQVLISRKRWIGRDDFLAGVSLAQALPGATGVTIMGYVGFRLRGVAGGLLAPLAFIAPATVLMVALAWAYFTYGSLPFVASLFAGLGALVVALLVNAFLLLGRSVFRTVPSAMWREGLLAAGGFVASFFFHVNVFWIVLALAAAGLLLAVTSWPPPESDDELAQASTGHQHRWSLLDLVTALPVLAALAAVLALPATRQLATTFLGIGSTAFGGGFGSIPLVQYQVVEVHGWLTPKEFVDGIALGQVTPGPVFITATFIGFRVAGVVGALAATLAAFLPSLGAMMLLADAHQRLRHHAAVRGVVRALQSGFVGLILAVTVHFALVSVRTWQEWVVVLTAFTWVGVLRRSSAWAILATILFSLVAIR